MKVAVLGLGETFQLFTRKSGDGITTIGCNDIYKNYPADYLVCVDPKRVFTPERLKTIQESTPRKMFSYLPEWEENFIGHFKLIKRASPRGSLKDIDDFNKVSYSICSPYIACIVAHQLGADEIVMHGVDFNNHQALSKPHKLAIIQRDFTNLYFELKKRKVNLFVGSKESFLSSFIPVKAN